ncbi:MAG: MBOAT family protein [Lachnospiraceae bacterium]|nr:MBOAT family protein [Lachnospiraceae bacterium]
MTLVSVSFLIFLAAAVLVYYLTPQKGQWIVLLLASLVFYWLCSKGFLIFLLLFAGIIYVFARSFETGKKKLLVLLEVAILIVLLIVLKYAGWFGDGFVRFLSTISFQKPLSFVAPLGISYVLLTGIGYSVDVFRGTVTAEKNFLKVLSFLSFFPAITQGPINRFSDLSGQLMEGHRFSYEALVFGIQRMLWGFVKKLVIAGRLNVVMLELTGSWQGSKYSGAYVVLTVAICSLNIFMDFSGCMDIVIGAAEIFGIRLPENFDHPYLARSMPEFWRKWHITLGEWLRDYVMFSFTMSAPAKKMNKSLKGKVGRKTAAALVSIIGVLFVWLVFGLWHGISGTFLLAAAYYALLIIGGIVIEEPVKRFRSKYPQFTESKGFQIFRTVRTYFLGIPGAYLMLMPQVKSGLQFLATIFTRPAAQFVVKITEGEGAGTFLLGLDIYDFTVLILSLILWLVVTTLHRKKDVRIRLSNIHIVPRWAILLAVVIAVVLFGFYGDLNAGSFIYQGY